jgi:hypothetical protein
MTVDLTNQMNIAGCEMPSQPRSGLKDCTIEDALCWDADSCLMVRRCGCWHSRRWTCACKHCRWAAAPSSRCCSDARQRPRRRTARLPRYRYNPRQTLLPQATAQFSSAKDCICDFNEELRSAQSRAPFYKICRASSNRRGYTAALFREDISSVAQRVCMLCNSVTVCCANMVPCLTLPF